jgi:hypothetical protein
LGGSKEGDQVPLEAFGRDGQDPADQGGVLGVAQGGVAEQGVDRGQAGVAGPGAVAPPGFQVGEERGDQRGVQVGQVELAWVLPGAVPGEVQQQPEGVPVGGDGVRAGLALAGEPLGEERLERGCQRGHAGPP